MRVLGQPGLHNELYASLGYTTRYSLKKLFVRIETELCTYPNPGPNPGPLQEQCIPVKTSF